MNLLWTNLRSHLEELCYRLSADPCTYRQDLADQVEKLVGVIQDIVDVDSGSAPRGKDIESIRRMLNQSLYCSCSEDRMIKLGCLERRKGNVTPN